MILVVGATGQLGSAVCRELAGKGHRVRALVRPGSRYRHLALMDVELLLGDLTDPDSLRAACRGVDAVIATANASVPLQRGCTFDAVEGMGYHHLLRACMKAPLQRFVFVSVPRTPYDDLVPSYRYKRLNEERIRQSGLPYTIVRVAPFMDDWLALMGSDAPLRGEPSHTLRRRYWFSRLYLGLFGRLMDGMAVALVPGFGWTRHAFITVDDVAAFLVRALLRDDAVEQTYHLGGPELLSWNEVVDICARALGRTVRRIHVPPVFLRLHQLALQHVAPAASNLIGASWIQSQWETLYLPAQSGRLIDPHGMVTVERYFSRKAAMSS